MSFFKASEFECSCGCTGNMIDPELLFILETIRLDVGFPMTITSGYRCRPHNIAVGGHKKSAHCTGQAVDISCRHKSAAKIISKALELGVTGIGISQKGNWGSRFVHLDISHDKFKMWSY